MDTPFPFKFNSDGLIPAIAQEATGESGVPKGRILMVAWMNAESLQKTIETGKMHYWSRSRKKLWFKGESSGHVQTVKRWFADCDADVLLFEIEQEGAACHTGYASCFFQEYDLTGKLLPIQEAKVSEPS